MSPSNLFVLGLLLLTANLSLCALFAPSRAGNGAAERLVQLWKLLFLAMIEVGAWAIVLHQGGAAPTLLETFTRCAACFALAGGADGGFAAPWGELKSFMALNGLLFIPVALIPWMSGAPPTEHGAGLPEDPLQIPDDLLLPGLRPVPGTFAPASPADAFDRENAADSRSAAVSQSVRKSPEQTVEDIRSATAAAPAARHSEPERLIQPLSISPGSPAPAGAASAPVPEQKPFGFRPTIPKVQSKTDAESPEAQLAEQMKPVGPTPPPIRFRWNDASR
jgi:hypothetical protein